MVRPSDALLLRPFTRSNWSGLRGLAEREQAQPRVLPSPVTLFWGVASASPLGLRIPFSSKAAPESVFDVKKVHETMVDNVLL